MDGAAPPPRRRLPTKTSSGRITIPPLAAANTTTTSTLTSTSSAELAHVKTPPDEDELLLEAARQQTLSPRAPTLLPSLGASSSLQDDDEFGCNFSAPASTSAAPTAQQQQQQPADEDDPAATATSEAAARSSMIATSSQPAVSPRPVAVAAAAAAAAVAARAGAMASRPTKAPSVLSTGPLNSSSAPHVVALPVKRRGSYQSLKRGTGLASALGSDSESTPNIVSLVKKTTHWERFGTILVLGCLYGDSETTVMQMLHAEGYDTSVAADQAKAMEMFNEMEVFPDIVLVDCDLPAFSTLQVISQFQALNPTVAVICLGSRGSTDAVSALQAGAADYMYRPVDLSELVARIERHVQRQHCVKLQLENVLEDTRSMMAQLSSAMALGNNVVMGRGSTSSMLAAGPSRLIAVAETDFEQQITELSDENVRLGSKLCELEERLERKVHENGEMAQKLTALEVHVHASSSGMQGQLCMVAQQNSALIDKVDALERIVRRSQECGRGDEAAAAE